jgi:ribosome-associated translation inhibitor RaiA
MNAELKTHGVPTSRELRAYVERRLGFTLDRHEERIARVYVTLEDVNGPKGGDDKRCRIDVLLCDGRAVRATAQEADAMEAVDIAAHRALRGVNRAVERLLATALDPRWLEQATTSDAL